MSIVRWFPTRELNLAKDEIDRVFIDLLGGRRGGLFGDGGTFVPAMDIREKADAWVVTAELPGMKMEDLKVTLRDNVLTVSGKKSLAEGEGDETGRRVERAYGSFERSFTLPEGVEADKVTAKLADGILTVRVGKPAEAKPREVSITIGN